MVQIIGWQMDDDDLMQVRLLEYLLHNAPSPQSACSLPDWVGDYGTQEHARARQHVSDFNAAGLLDLWDASANPLLCISALGRQDTNKILAVRDDRQARDAGVHDAMLKWLDDMQVQGNFVTSTRELSQSAYGKWFGDPFTTRETDNAAKALKEEGYISGIETGSRDEIVRPSLLQKGRRTTRAKRSVFDDDHLALAGDHYTFNQQATTLNSQVGGQGSSLTMNVTMSAEQQASADALAALLDQIGSEEAAAAATQIRDTDVRTDRGLFQGALLAALGAASAVVGTEAGQGAVQLVTSLLTGG